MINDFSAQKRERCLLPLFLISMLAMAGPFLNPTSLPCERPGLSDSQSGAQGSHGLGKGGDDVAPMAGIRAMMHDAVSGAVVGKEQQCWCPPGIRIQWSVILDAVVMGMVGIITGKTYVVGG